MGEVDYKSVATNTGDEPPKTPGPGYFPRRPSRDSLMSNLSPYRRKVRREVKASARDVSSRPGSDLVLPIVVAPGVKQALAVEL